MKIKFFRNIALCAVNASIVMGSFSAPDAVAQENQEASNGVLEEVVIVGSRIKRKDEVANSPVQTLNSDDLRATGSLSIGESLQALPSIGSSLSGNGSAGTSHGSSSLNLRNVGENRSLVLVNGHRWVNGVGGRGVRDFVDMNTIPQVMVGQIEVLQDGATAIYGADAIAGVVNIHTYKSYEGVKITGYFGAAGEGDRETTNFDFLWGKSFGESNWMVALTYADQEPVFTPDRALTAVPINASGVPSGTTEGVFIEDGLAAVTAGGNTSISRDPGVEGSVIANWRASNSETDRFNRYTENYVVSPLERTAVYIQNRTSLTDTMELSMEALYNKRESGQRFSPVIPVVRGSRGFIIANDPLVNPFGVEFSGEDFRVNNLFSAIGQRDNTQDVDTLRFGVGLSGEFANGWSWDTFGSWAENEATFTSMNQIHLDKLALGLRACDSTGLSDVSSLAANCVPVNLFEPLTQEMIDYIRFTGEDTNRNEQLDFTFNFTGELFDLPAGTLAFAAGAEYREEQGEDIPDAVIASDPLINTFRTTSSAPREGTDGEYDLTEIYVEFSVPLLADIPMAEELTLDLASRYSDYSTFGDTTNSKVGIGYRPVSDLLVRGTWAEGFRAPSIAELFEGARTANIPVADPCANGGAGGVGCSGVPLYTQNDANVSGSVGGNLNLQPETSKNYSFGIVYTPAWLEGSSMTLDWYRIEIEDTISTFGAQNLLDLCASSGQRCGLISRDSTGEITNIVDGAINLNSTEIEGLDVVFRYATETTLGNLDLALTGSRLLDFVETSILPDGSVLEEDKVGVAERRASFPEWRASFSATLGADTWLAKYVVRYIGDTQEIADATPRNIEQVFYHDISGSYNFTDALAAKVGVNNLADEQPPSSLTNTNINFDQRTYDGVGRFFYLAVTYDLDI